MCTPNSSDQLSIKALIEIERESVIEANVIKGRCSGDDKCDRDEQFCICIYVCGCVYVRTYFMYVHPKHTSYTHTHTRARARAYYYKCYTRD